MAATTRAVGVRSSHKACDRLTIRPVGPRRVKSLVSSVTHAVQAAAPAALAVLDATTGIPSMVNDVHTIFFSNASPMDKIMAGADLLINVAMDASMVVGVGEGLRAAYVGAHIVEHVAEDAGVHALEHAGEDAVAHTVEHEAESEAEHAGEHAVEDGVTDCAESFAARTLVATPLGARPIASLKTSDQVLAHDPSTGKASTQTVTATSLHHDDNLVDITLRVSGPATPAHAIATSGKGAAKTTSLSAATHDEVVHTTTNHPWLTADHGWLPASFLAVGEPVVLLDGTTATVEVIHVVPGAAAMWDLTVSNVHTFAVGTGQFVVHNCGDEVRAATERMNNAVRDHLKPSDLEGAWRDAHGNPVPRAGGGFYDHLGEVMDARDSLVNSAEVYKSALNDTRTAAEDIPRIQRLLSYASRTADRVESIISSDRWIPGTYIAPFRFR